MILLSKISDHFEQGQFLASVQCGGVEFDCKGSYSRYGWEVDTVKVGGHEIWHGLRPEWQAEIKEQIGIKIANQQGRGT